MFRKLFCRHEWAYYNDLKYAAHHDDITYKFRAMNFIFTVQCKKCCKIRKEKSYLFSETDIGKTYLFLHKPYGYNIKHDCVDRLLETTNGIVVLNDFKRKIEKKYGITFD